MGIRLWLDDKRPCPEGWVHAKTAVEAIEILGAQEVDEAALDHDLGHCEQCTGCAGYKSTCGCRCHWTGYTVALWMASTGKWPMQKPTCHSANPAGRANIESVVSRYFGVAMVYDPGEFRLSWKQQSDALHFRERHGAKHGKVPHGFTYKFHQTGVGVASCIVCETCRKKKDLSEYHLW